MVDLNPFAHIDINSGLHRELSPYKIYGGFFYYPKRYYDLYLEELFDDNDIDNELEYKIPITDQGFLINSKGLITDINLERIENEQRKTFHIDHWYVDMENKCQTFDCYIINLTQQDCKLLTDRRFQHRDLLKLKTAIRKIMVDNCHIKWWFVKLNSVSPKDLSKSGKQHKYKSINLMLKRLVDSDRTCHFLKYDKEAKLILRPWYDLPEKWEFRCFIYKKKLRAISQYQCYTYYPDFQNEIIQNIIKSRIINFYESTKRYIPFSDCVMDVIIWDNAPIPSFLDQKVYIIEFNEFGGETACGSGLYNWVIDYDQLYNSEHTVIRFVNEESEIDKLARQLDMKESFDDII